MSGFDFYGWARTPPPDTGALVVLEARTVAAIDAAGDTHATAIAAICEAPDDAEASRRLALWAPRMTAADAAMTAALDQLSAARRETR